MRTETTERVQSIVAPLLEARGVDLYDVEAAPPVLRILVDRPGGIDLEALGELTRTISDALDDDDPVAGRYTLEVSSPGLERPLRTRRHFEAALGTKVRVKTVAGTEGERRVEGTLRAADDEGVEVELAGGTTRRVAYDEVERARTVFEWGPAARPSSPGKRKASKP